MQFKTAKKWFIPYGTWIIMTHDEACWLTSNVSLDVITGAISAIGTVHAAARYPDTGPRALHSQLERTIWRERGQTPVRLGDGNDYEYRTSRERDVALQCGGHQHRRCRGIIRVI